MQTDCSTVRSPIAQLRDEHYNARVVKISLINDDLMILRVRPDGGVPYFLAGQYTVLGLGMWESRIEGVQPEPPDSLDPCKLIKRAYSISCSLLDDRKRLMRGPTSPYFEFYIALVRQADRRPPALTPRLFALREGDRIHCGPHIHGVYTLKRVGRDDSVIFAATGTGEAPHNAMLADLLAAGHRGRIASVTCVRWKKDLGYRKKHREIERRYPNYRYLTFTTREVENLDPEAPGFVGKQYLQGYFESGQFERDTGWELEPEKTQIFLCGSPAMIGVPQHTHNHHQRYPKPKGMVEVLENRGFRVDQPHEPGNIHFEKYW